MEWLLLGIGALAMVGSWLTKSMGVMVLCLLVSAVGFGGFVWIRFRTLFPAGTAQPASSDTPMSPEQLAQLRAQLQAQPRPAAGSAEALAALNTTGPNASAAPPGLPVSADAREALRLAAERLAQANTAAAGMPAAVPPLAPAASSPAEAAAPAATDAARALAQAERRAAEAEARIRAIELQLAALAGTSTAGVVPQQPAVTAQPETHFAATSAPEMGVIAPDAQTPEVAPPPPPAPPTWPLPGPGVDANALARRYLQPLFDGQPLPPGVGHAHLLDAARLDFSAASLEHVDEVLAALASEGSAIPALLADKGDAALLHLLAFYLGTTAAINGRHRVHWLTIDLARDLLRGAEPPPGPAGSLVGLFQERPALFALGLPLARLSGDVRPMAEHLAPWL